MGVTSVFSPWLLTADDAAAASRNAVGGKAHGLARLRALGANVPPWGVVEVTACEEHIHRADVAGRLAEILRPLDAGPVDPEAIERASTECRALIEAAPLDATLGEAVTALLSDLGPGPFAVRSSMAEEDANEHSFAGQFDSFLNIEASQVARAIVRCWSSAFTARALQYRRRISDALGVPVAGVASIDARLPRMAVVIQQMVDADVSGVMFTGPVVQLSACWGLGEGIVSGVCDCDEYAWSTDRGEVHARIADKRTMITRTLDRTGTHESDVTEARRTRRCLAPDEVRRIAEEGLRIAAASGAAQDIEWSMVAGELFILQARPITAPVVFVQAADANERVVWDNSNIQESYCGVTTPLTFSFAADAYASVYAQTMRAVGLSEADIARHRPLLENLLGLIGGRVYYNIRNWYRGLLLLPSFGQNKEDMERMMGLETPVEFIVDERPTWLDRLRRLPALVRTAARLVVRFASLERAVASFLRDFEANMAKVDRSGLPGMSLGTLVATLDTLRGDFLGRWHVPIINDFRVMMSVGRLRRFVERTNVDVRVEDLLAAIEGIESVEPTRALMRMAEVVRATPPLASALAHAADVRDLSEIAAQFPGFAALVAQYLERYGDRCMGELKLETVSLREDPSFMIEMIREYAASPELDTRSVSAADKARYTRAVRDVNGRLSPLGRWRFGRMLGTARRAVRDRESMRLARTRVFGLFRDTYLAIGARLVDERMLDSVRDVFYLTTHEIEAFYAGTGVTADLGGLARMRKAEFLGYESIELPNRVETTGAIPLSIDAVVRSVPPTTNMPNVLVGLGCSAGVAEGEVAIVRGPRDSIGLRGKILVATRTDPGWGPLFPLAHGILIERGSTLSHSAVLARELGIPAVVGIPNLLAVLRSGERVRMDGASGRVERLEEPCTPHN